MVTIKTAFSGFSVTDLEKTKAFYRDVLELSIEDTGMGLKISLPGGGTVFAYPKENHQPATFTILNFEVENIDEAVADLKSKGIEFERYDDMPQDEKGIMRGRSVQKGPDIAWFTDPSGNILSILQDK